MWTYMMAASRGVRANMIMSASRCRNESESPKYGYNTGHNVLPLHSSASSTLTLTMNHIISAAAMALRQI
ncbi:uncharacterized protein LOC114804544 [Zeugodacus cucurbitae]|uniref:uncharacterized protein LOC114804544 n=1 Tax=Zeugodacus cucurbitae TaxID=28588 RepID=UPI0023D9321D|nr:uncharacterized protein LOC114804544 [Zeugodacus cucurbitae]